MSAAKSTGKQSSGHRMNCFDALSKALEIFTVSNAKSFDDVISDALKPIADVFDLDIIAVYCYKSIDGAERLGQVYRWDKSAGGIIPVHEGLITLPDNDTVKEWTGILRDNNSIFRSQSNMTKPERAFTESFGVKSVFLAPVFQRDQLWAAVAFQNHHNDVNFCDGLEDLLRSAANMCAAALIRDEKTKSAESAAGALKYRERMLKALNEMAVALLSYESEAYEEVISRGLKPVCNTAGVDRVAVYRLLDKDVHLGQVYLWFGQTIPIDEDLRVVPLDPPVIRWLDVLTKGGCINASVDDMPDDEAAWLSQFGAKGIYFVPIFTHERFWGVVALEDHTCYRRFDDDCLGLLQSAAHLCADVVIRSEMAKEIRLLETEADKIYIDPLTGIYNRRFFDENLGSIVQNLSRSSGSLSMMMIDIDFFKIFNDTYGHSEGDRCLQMIAGTLSRGILRTNDFIARYGGEEFIVVLPNTEQEGACMLANKFLDNVRALKIPHKESSVADCVTISIGVATGTVHHMQTGEDYIKLADEMLYISKRKGRNRFTFKGI